MGKRKGFSKQGWNNRGHPHHHSKNKKRSWVSKVFENRRNPRASFVPFYDIWLNIKEGLYCWNHRVPRGSYLNWKDGKIHSHTTRSRY